MTFLEKSGRKCIDCNEALSRLWGEERCPKCKQLYEDKDEIEFHKKVKQNSKNVIVSTTHTLQGYEIEEYLGIESAEVVLGTSFFNDLAAGLSDFLGTRSTGYESSLSSAKKEAFEILKYKASLLGGNAVVGVDVDYLEIGNRMMGVIVGGTVVVINKTQLMK